MRSPSTSRLPLKKPTEFKVIGQSFRRRDLPGKVFGTLDMVNDVRLPGMLHARMIRPTVAGAVPVKVDEGSIKRHSGRHGGLDQGPARRRRREGMERRQGRQRPQGDLVGLASRISRATTSCTSTSATRRWSSATIQRENGTVEEGFKQAVRIIEGEYEYPTQSHASMGPACAVADVRDGEATIWT